MCGIAGIFGEPDAALLERMTLRLRHRGPDSRGTVQLGDVGLGNTRLSLLDYEQGEQPLVASEAGLGLVYNGEIYNHREVRRTLRDAGYEFAGHCDTEVLLRAYQEWGDDAFRRLDGMYAAAFAHDDELLLVRDPFGIKPLFYAVTDGGRRLVFASEIKALLEDPRVPRRLDRRSLADRAVFRFVLGAKTWFRDISQVPAGSLLRVRRRDDGTLALTLEQHTPVERLEFADLEAALDTLEAALEESVALQRRADHPVGIFLSGGLDSSLLGTFAARQAPGSLHTFTIAASSDHPDAAAARQVAAALGTVHHEHLEPLPDLDRALAEATAVHEGPSSFSILDVAAAPIRRHVKAILCGDGADELFAGYRVHAAPMGWIKWAGTNFNRLVATGGLTREEAADSKRALAGLLTGDLAEARDRVHRFYLDSQLQYAHLQHWDRGAMAASLEVRVPYLSSRLRNVALSIPWRWRLGERTTKAMLRRLGLRVLPPEVRDLVVTRRKLAAPSAFPDLDRDMERLAAAAIPEELAAEHPLRHFFTHPTQQLQTDLFLWLFMVRGGHLPDGFTVSSLYTEHREELLDCLHSDTVVGFRAAAD